MLGITPKGGEGGANKDDDEAEAVRVAGADDIEMEDEGATSNPESDVANLLNEAREMRQRAVRDFPEAIVDDPDIMEQLVLLQPLAQSGDRESYMVAVGRLNEIFKGHELY